MKRAGQDPSFNPTTYYRDVMVNDPDAKRQTLAGRAKRVMATAEASRR